MIKILVSLFRAILRLLVGSPTKPKPPPEPIPPENRPPEIYPPFMTECSPFESMGKVVIDFRYQERGCAYAGLTRYGIRDLDSKSIKLSVRIVDMNAGEDEALFIQRAGERLRIDGMFISEPVLVWFPGWNRDTPPYPFSLMCDRTPQPDLGTPSTNLVSLMMIVEARDEQGGISQFRLPMERMGCPCRRRQS